MLKIRRLFYAVTLILLVIPIIPLPFSLPLLNDFFGGNFGTVLVVFIVFGVILFEVIAIILLIYKSFVTRKINKSFVVEFAIFPIVVFWLAWLNFSLIDKQIDFIYRINENKLIEDFHNPFLGFQMLDCRRFSERLDVIFIPRHLSIETDYLAYAPKVKATEQSV